MRPAAIACLLGLVVAAACVQAAAGPRATLDGQAAAALMVQIREGTPYLALTGLEHLHATTVFDRVAGCAAIGIGRRSLLLRAGSNAAVLDGEPVEGPRPPFVENGHFWLPASWLERFSLKVRWDERSGTLALSWPRAYLLDVHLDKTSERPRLILEANAPVEASVFAIKGPERLVIDLKGLQLYEHIRLEDRENEYFLRLRAAPNRPGVLRVVADLRQPFGYAVETGQAKTGRIALDLDTLVYESVLLPAADGSKLAIRTNHRPLWTVSAFTNPDRVVVEIDRATLVGPPSAVPGDDSWLHGVELRSLKDKVQIVAVLKKPVACSIALSRGRDNAIEIQPLQNLGRLIWRQETNGFTLRGAGPLTVYPEMTHYPERLTLTIMHAQAVPDAGILDEGPVKWYKIQQLQSGLVEVAMELRYDSRYQLELSADQRELTVRFQPSPLIGKVIVLDAGHGGVETGAIGRTLGLREKDVNLDVTLRLKELLEGAGAVVHLTRVDDTYVPLFSRASFANRLPADIFVSIHANAHDDPAVNGFEVFHYPGRVEDKRLAGLILEDMVEALALLPRGVKANDFAVLRDSQITSILLEMGFLTNQAEEARLVTDAFRERAAWAIFRALVRFCRGEAAASALRGPGLGN